MFSDNFTLHIIQLLLRSLERRYRGAFLFVRV